MVLVSRGLKKRGAVSQRRRALFKLPQIVECTTGRQSAHFRLESGAVVEILAPQFHVDHFVQQCHSNNATG